MGFFRAAHGWRGVGGGGAKWLPLPKICITYPTMIKLGTVLTYLKKIQKNMNYVIHPLISAETSIFLPEIGIFRYINKYRYRFRFHGFPISGFLVLSAFLESLQIVLIKMVIDR